MQTTLLLDTIISDIQQSPNRAISFSQFMQRALYEPQYGYYRASQAVIGKDRDYITAPEISPLFGQCIAQNIRALQSQLPASQLVEIGAGNGTLAADILIALAASHHLPPAYLIIEPDSYHQQRQYSTLQERCPDLLGKVQWLEVWPQQLEETIMIANELVDALPVNTYVKRENGYAERLVTVDEGKLKFCESIHTQVADVFPEIINYLDTATLPLPYYFEIAEALPRLLQHMADSMQKGAILLFDYGYPRSEYYHPQRHAGHLVCYRQQQMNFDPLYQPGRQDISTHVDFTFVAECADHLQLEVTGFCTQAAFLLSSGITDMMAERQALAKQNFAMNQAVQLLTSPAEMGELVKVMALGKNFSLRPPGFHLRDDRGRL